MKTVTALLAAALLSGAAAAQPRIDADAKLDRALAGRVAGQPVSCLTLTRSIRTEVIPGQAILYRIGGSGGRVYVNRPVSGAEWLNSEAVPVTVLSTTQQCRNDPVQLVNRLSGIQRGAVILGEFVPYTRVTKRG